MGFIVNGYRAPTFQAHLVLKGVGQKPNNIGTRLRFWALWVSRGGGGTILQMKSVRQYVPTSSLPLKSNPPTPHDHPMGFEAPRADDVSTTSYSEGRRT